MNSVKMFLRPLRSLKFSLLLVISAMVLAAILTIVFGEEFIERFTASLIIGIGIFGLGVFLIIVLLHIIIEILKQIKPPPTTDNPKSLATMIYICMVVCAAAFSYFLTTSQPVQSFVTTIVHWLA